MAPVHRHDSLLLPESVRELSVFAASLGLHVRGARITFDSGFDGRENKRCIREAHLVPVIHPNRRNAREPIAIARMYRWFDRETYKLRFPVERTFAWQDVYRRIATCYERLTATRKGLRYLAYAMINYRDSL